MLIKMFLKEWKERIPFFLLEILLMAALVVLRLMKNDLLFNYMTGMILIFFIPFAALLIGSSAFHAEFKNDAWTYLFSRPVKKWVIWMVKFAAQLTVLATIFLLFLLLLGVLPGLKDVVESYGLASWRGSLSMFTASFLVSLAAFVVAFSLSFLYEKQLIILLLTIVVGVGSAALLSEFLVTVTIWYPLLPNLKGITILWPLAFAAASVRTFSRADFSQPRKKILGYVGSAAAFLAAALAASAVLSVLTLERRHYILRLQSHQGQFYFTSERKLFRFDPALDRIERIARIRPAEFSLGDGKMAFIRAARGKDIVRQAQYELGVMNPDGTGERILVEAPPEGSPDFDRRFTRLLVSPDGGEIAYLTRWGAARGGASTLWTIRSDGTDLRKFPGEFPEANDIEFKGWTKSGRGLIVFWAPPMGASDMKNQVLKLDLDSGERRSLAENVFKSFDLGLSPDKNHVALVVFDETEGRETLELMDPETMERTKIAAAATIDRYKWSERGDRIAFLLDRSRLCVYEVAENRVRVIKDFMRGGPAAVAPPLAWAWEDRKIIVGDLLNGEPYLRVFDAAGGTEQQVGVPFRSRSAPWLLAFDDCIMVRDFDRGRMWRLRLATEDWKRIY